MDLGWLNRQVAESIERIYCSVVNKTRISIRLHGLPLGHAVDRAKPTDPISAAVSDNFAVGKDFGKNVERDAGVGIVETRSQDSAICNVEIRVACGQSAAIKINWGGHREIDRGERFAAFYCGI